MLRISDTLSLPVDYVTKGVGILAQRRKGKTYLAKVIAEELVAAQIPFVALDPTGAWWGLRASADGKTEGLPVVILGGDHGDVPLERGSGALVAELVIDHPGYYVIDFSGFESGQAEKQFATDFAKRLYRRKAQPGADFAMHLFIDEADRFVPQTIQDRKEGDAAMLGAFETIVRRGGIRGLGTTLISQRPAVVNKNVLEQIDLLILLRVVGPNDQKAVRTYIGAHGSEEESKALMASLASLDIGEAWLWEPGAEPPLFDRVRIRTANTFNSSATPKAGETRVEPKRLAAVDLDTFKEAMADTIEKQRADDPKALRAIIQKLTRENLALERHAKDHAAVEAEVPVEVEVARLPDGSRLAVATILEHGERMLVALRSLSALFEKYAEEQRDRKDVPRTRPAGRRADPVERPRPAQRPDRTPRRNESRAPVPRAETPEVAGIGKGERKVLDVLAQYPEGRTHNELAFLAGYSAKASTLGVILSKLRKLDLVEQAEKGMPIRPTAAGLAAVGGAVERPTGQALLDQWLRHPRMGEGERKVLLALIDAYPDAPTHLELCETTGYSPDASTMGVILSKLRKLGLVEKGARRVLAEFMESIDG